METTLLEYDFRKGQQSKQVNLEKAGEDSGAAEIDEEELEEKIDEEVYQYTDWILMFFFVCVLSYCIAWKFFFYGFCVYFF